MLKKFEKMLLVFLVVLVVFSAAIIFNSAMPGAFTASAYVEGGKCGDNATWSYDSSTREFTISGSGAMYDYADKYEAPFDNYVANKITIGSGITKIGNYAFCSNSAKSVTIPSSVTSIGDYAFAYADLEEIIIGSGVKTIGQSAFWNCSYATKITIGSNVTDIGKNAFGACGKIKNITIPKNVKNIGETAFYGCANLETISVNYSNSYYTSDIYGVLYNKYKTELITAPRKNGLTTYVIPSSVKRIADDAFRNHDTLKSLTISNGTNLIGNYAFYNCYNLESLVLPDSLTTISEFAFCHCDSVKSVTIPDSVTTIDDYAFYACESMESLSLSRNLKSIGEMAFSECYSIKEIVIPKSVTTINECAFSATTSLQRIIVEEGNAYYVADDDGVLYNIEKTQLIQFPLGKAWAEYTIPYGVRTVGTFSFQSSPNLEKVIIPDSVETIGKEALANMKKLKTITISDSVTTVENGAFCHNHALESVEIGKGLTAISQSAFLFCDSLKNILIPKNITEIQSSAFQLTNNLETVHYTGTADDWSKVTIVNSGNNPLKNAVLHCVEEKDAVKASCSGSGYTAGLFCSACDKWLKGHEVIPSGNHANTVSYPQQDASCTETGFTAGIYCSDCKTWIDGHDVIPATNHINKTEYAQQDASCNESGFTAGTYCSDCKTWIYGHEEIPAAGHIYNTTTVKATVNSDGVIESKCACGDVKASEVIAKIESVTLSKTKYVHDGKNKTPKVTVTDANGKKLVKNVDYKTSVASKRSGIGRYTVKVTFIGKYEGSKKVYFTILPGKPVSVKSASQTTSSVKLSWSEVSGAAGYTVYRYSPSKKAYVKAGTTESTSLTVKSLLTGTKYTFRVVAYGKTASGKVYNSESYALVKTATKTKTPELTKVTASSTKGKAYVYHTDVSGETGYTVYYSTKKDSGFKKYANFKADTTRCDITNLVSGNTYYFKVRTYITTNSGYVYSAWSSVKSVKVK